jgi:predicted amidohydrolase YtcJ
VVTQSGFIATRGERYRALVDAAEQPDLYRCATLLAAGVPVGGSSDAPYGDLDPWAGIRAAITRRTAGGHALGGAEAISAPRALALYLTAPDAPGGAPRRICAGAAADLCLIDGPVEAALTAPAGPAVVATVVGGAVSYRG